MKTVIEMALEAGMLEPGDTEQDIVECGVEVWLFGERGMKALERFAELVRADEREKQAEAFQQILAAVRNDTRADEREACAKVCDDFERAKWESVKNISQNGGRLAFAGPMHCAVAIRARGQA